MTNCDYIQKTLSLFGIGQDTVDIILTDSNLDAEGSLDKLACKKAIKKDFHLVRTAAHRNVSEGGFSLSWVDCERALKSMERSLDAEIGDNTDDSGGYGCVDRSYMW